MDRNFAAILPETLKWEGGYVDHPNDPGGATNKGVTLASFRKYVKPNGTKADLKKLTTDQASAVYYKHYWAPIWGPQLPSGVDMAVFDYGVNSGPGTAIKVLQRVVGCVADGKVGPKTIACAEKMDAHDVIDAICDRRLASYKTLKNKKTGKALWPTFGKGWARRIEGIRTKAHSLVGKDFNTRTVKTTVTKPVALVADASLQKPWYQSLDVQTVLGGGGLGVAGLGSTALDVLPSIDWKTLAVVLSFVMVGIAVLFIVNRSRKQAVVAEKVAKIEAQDEVVEVEEMT